jgi:predicted alpha/beta-fold hydrolase
LVVARDPKYTFRPAWWIRGGHAQTLWGKFFRRHPPTPIRRERWDTPDGDFVDVHRLDAANSAPRLVFFHGLEGTIRSHYVFGFFNEARRRGWGADLLIFRGCGDEPNHTRRFYHSGETTDPVFVIDRVRAEHPSSPIVLAGVSLGGNVLLKYLGEQGTALTPQIRAAAAVSVPFDLERSCRHISHGFSKVYDRHFLRTLRKKAMLKLGSHPGLFDPAALDRATAIYDFDDVVTAPVHGFASAHDYYSRSSALGFLSAVRRPTLLLNAIDDPFLPAAILDDVRAVAERNPLLTLEFTEHGGHVGFVGGIWPWRPDYYAERRVCEFLAAAL